MLEEISALNLFPTHIDRVTCIKEGNITNIIGQLPMLDNFIDYIVALYCLSFIVWLLSLYVAEICILDFFRIRKTLKDHSKNIKHLLIDNIIHFTVPKAYFSHFLYFVSYSFSSNCM